MIEAAYITLCNVEIVPLLTAKCRIISTQYINDNENDLRKEHWIELFEDKFPYEYGERLIIKPKQIIKTFRERVD
jgi:hypothetical protein